MKFKSLLVFVLLAVSGFYACEKDESQKPIITDPTDTTDTMPVTKYEVIDLSTDFGHIWIWLYDTTAQHKANFLKLTKEGYFDGTTFHRIIDGFMIQGGDPNSKDADTTNDGTGGPGYTIPAEFVSGITHIQGALGAARTNNPQKASSGSQFYIVENKTGAHHLDMNYTVFGQVMSGIDVVETIAVQPKNASDRPFTDIKMIVKVVEKSKDELKSEFGWDIP